jgi:hypothetical protein
MRLERASTHREQPGFSGRLASLNPGQSRAVKPILGRNARLLPTLSRPVLASTFRIGGIYAIFRIGILYPGGPGQLPPFLTV